ncbi:MAG: substrate-binding domain-containing protein [Candidatus Rokubacteria bacterium]|nr:substrate-binding domain-containing protein [Candidatus Rokubacteria bacterium]
MSPRKHSFSSKSVRFTILLLWALVVVPAWGEEKIVLDGSSGMLPLATALATAYQQRASDPQIETGKGLGTGARLQALAEGKIQIALASHGLKSEDIEKGKLRVIEVAKGAIVFAVNAGVPITNITEAQVCDVYSGKSRSWRLLGGPDSAIAVLTRPPQR